MFMPSFEHENVEIGLTYIQKSYRFCLENNLNADKWRLVPTDLQYVNHEI